MQSEFAEQVGRQHGLERGLEGPDRAIRRFRPTTVGWRRGASKRSMWTFLIRLSGIVNVRAYGEKVAKSVVGQLRPKWQERPGQGQRAGGGQEGRTRQGRLWIRTSGCGRLWMRCAL